MSPVGSIYPWNVLHAITYGGWVWSWENTSTHSSNLEYTTTQPNAHFVFFVYLLPFFFSPIFSFLLVLLPLDRFHFLLVEVYHVPQNSYDVPGTRHIVRRCILCIVCSLRYLLTLYSEFLEPVRDHRPHNNYHSGREYKDHLHINMKTNRSLHSRPEW